MRFCCKGQWAKDCPQVARGDSAPVDPAALVRLDSRRHHRAAREVPGNRLCKEARAAARLERKEAQEGGHRVAETELSLFAGAAGVVGCLPAAAACSSASR